MTPELTDTSHVIFADMMPGYVRAWCCDPPPWGSMFTVPPGAEEWTEEHGFPVRHIFRWKTAEGRA